MITDEDGNLLSDSRWKYIPAAENCLKNMECIADVPDGEKCDLVFGYDYLGRGYGK